MSENKALERLLNSLIDHQSTIFEQGHDFWYCDAYDTNDKGVYKPFRYYQTNRSQNMATCGNCQKLMELRKEIRAVEKQLGRPLTPLYTNITNDEAVKRISVQNASIFNPNYSYLS